MIDIGLVLDRSVHSLSPAELARRVQEIEALGFESVWTLDPFGVDPFQVAAFVLANTSTLKAATGVATVYGRDPMGAVQIRMALSRYYPGRFMMGLGASNPIVVGKRGHEWVPPLTKMKAYLEQMESSQLGVAATSPIAPLYIAAHAPGLQDLAVKHCDGIITWILPPPLVAASRQRVGNEQAVTAEIPCVFSDDPVYARGVARAFLSIYIGLPYYQTAYGRLGFESSDYEQGGSDRLIDAIVAWGTPEEIRARVGEFEQAGASRLVLNLVKGPATGTPAVLDLETDWASLSGVAKALF
ncbi:LLM class flavin-dependent oxidoreductase [Sphingobium mellinum]|uniref:LLM class flavin-dependent oxidoreductase n=1 Tax=Sphingobium mellinum TaxID=1387166 RepID=UPI0030EE4615